MPVLLGYDEVKEALGALPVKEKGASEDAVQYTWSHGRLRL